jgi:prepilin-type N-terminal cleavage/methylation domain-containing protein
MRRRRAFTLLELLLAMGLVAMLSLTLYSSFNTAYKAKRTAEATVRPVRAVSVAMELITRDLQNATKPALPSGTVSPTPIPPPVLSSGFYAGHEGGVGTEADWLDFHVIGSDAMPNLGAFSEGIRRVDWGVKNDGSTTLLVRRVTRNILAPIEEEPEEQIIARDVKAFAVKSFDGVDWYEEWDSSLTPTPNQMPLFVQVDLTVGLPEQTSNQQPRLYHVSQLVQIPTAP